MQDSLNGDKPEAERIEEESSTAEESLPVEPPEPAEAAELAENEAEREERSTEAPDRLEAVDASAPEASEPAALEGALDAETDEAAEGPALSLEETQASVEALLYASSEPLSVRDLKKAIPEAGERLRPALDRLKEAYGIEGRGLQLIEIAGGFQITTRPEYHEVVSRLVASPKPARLSLQALETLAVIAYRQPVTVPEIMDLRGVRSAGVVRTLLEKKLIKIVGRKNVVGRPLMYGTTKEFLLRFALKDVKDLPQLKDMSEVFGDEVAQQLEVLEELDAAKEVSFPGDAEPTDSAEPEPSDAADEELEERDAEHETDH